MQKTGNESEESKTGKRRGEGEFMLSLERRLVRIVVILAVMGVFLCGVVFSTAVAEENYNFVVGADRQGTWYVITAGWGKIMHEALPNVNMTVEATAGALANTQLIEKKNIDFGVTMDFNAGESFAGADWTNGVKYTRQRALFPIQVSYLHIVTLEKAGLKNITDFNNKVVCASPQGASAAIVVNRMLDALGVKPKKLINGSQAQNFELLQDGQALAAMHTWGLPAAAVEDLAAVAPVRLLSLTNDQVKIMQKKYPLHSIGKIPAGTYKWLKDDVTTIYLWSYLICDKDLPEDIVYKMVKATYENSDKLRAIHAATAVCIPKNFTHLSIPLHPGAAKYYKEIGLGIPKNLQPIE
jgi:TRAP transporter TAXI family solute receptor